MGEAVQHRPPPGQPRHRQPVVLLVQEEAGFLPVLHVHQIADAVFRDLRHSRVRRCFAGKREPALALGQPFLFPQEQQVLDTLHANGEDLHAQKIVELVHCQPREGVCLPEDDAAGVQVLWRHHALSILPGPLELPAPEGLVEAIVRIPGEKTYSDFRVLGIKSRTKIPALPTHHVHHSAIVRLAGAIPGSPRRRPRDGPAGLTPPPWG